MIHRSVITRLDMLHRSAAWALTFILGNVPKYRTIPVSEDSKQQKESLVDPNPPFTSNEEYLNFSSNKATRLSIRSPCLRITKLAWDWMRSHVLWPLFRLYLEFWKTQDRVSYFFMKLLCLLVTFLWWDSAKDNIPFVTVTSAQVELTRFKLYAGCSPCV